MITATRYIVEQGKANGVYSIGNKDIPLCPDCGQKLSGYDSRLRHVIDGSGEVRWFLLRRLRCSTCRKIHLEIPDFIQPKKHYSAQLIKEVLLNNVDICPADDSTIRRWKKVNNPPALPSVKNNGGVLSNHTDIREGSE